MDYSTRFSRPFRGLCAFVCFTFFITFAIPPTPGDAQIISQVFVPLSSPGAMIGPSIEFAPTIVRGLTIHPENPFQFDFIIDTGDENLQGQAFQEESTKLIKYFLASLTVPDDEFWVNLSPDEKDRIAGKGLRETQTGLDMLAQDYLLKQLTATFMYPEKELGQRFWKRVYQQVRQKYGNVDIPMDNFHKVWIVPDKATVYEHNGSVFVVERHLRVLLEKDYLAQQNNQPQLTDNESRQSKISSHLTRHSSLPENQSVEIDEIIREIIIPEIEHEVNYGKNFSQLRQIYNSMILATWYKRTLKDSLLSQVYVNQNKVKGVDIDDKMAPEKIYAQYMEAFKKGVYNYIKEEVDPETDQVIPKQYFSGGITRIEKLTIKNSPLAQQTSAVRDAVMNPESTEGHDQRVTWKAVEHHTAQAQQTEIEKKHDDKAMLSNHLSKDELDLLRETDEIDGFISKRAFSETRVRKQLAQILHNTSWWKKSSGITEEDLSVVNQVEERHMLAGPGTDSLHYQERPWYQELSAKYHSVLEKISVLEQAEAEKIIALVKENSKLFKGEEVHVLNGVGVDARVIGRIDRGIAEKFGFIHETANVVLVTPDGKVLLQLRNKKNFDDHLAMYGGHLGVGESHFSAVIEETLQETGLEKLDSDPVFIGYEGYDIEGDNNKERRSWFVKKLTDAAYVNIKQKIQDLNQIKKVKSRADVKEELFKQQAEKKDGSGEVIGIYPVSFEEILNAKMKNYQHKASDPVTPFEGGTVHYLTVHDEFQGKDVAIDAFFTPDSLDRLIFSKVLWADIHQRALAGQAMLTEDDIKRELYSDQDERLLAFRKLEYKLQQHHQVLRYWPNTFDLENVETLRDMSDIKKILIVGESGAYTITPGYLMEHWSAWEKMREQSDGMMIVSVGEGAEKIAILDMHQDDFIEGNARDLAMLSNAAKVMSVGLMGALIQSQAIAAQVLASYDPMAPILDAAKTEQLAKMILIGLGAIALVGVTAFLTYRHFYNPGKIREVNSTEGQIDQSYSELSPRKMLYKAAETGNLQLFEKAISLADFKISQQEMNKAFGYAVTWGGNLDLIRRFVEEGADINYETSAGSALTILQEVNPRDFPSSKIKGIIDLLKELGAKNSNQLPKKNAESTLLFNQYNQIMLNYFHIPSTVLIKITPIVRRMVVIHDEYVIEYLKSMKKVLQHQPVFSELVLLIDNRLSSEGDKAMLAKQKDADIQMPDGSEAPGGVDFNPQGLELKIKRDGNGIPLPLPQQPIEIMQIEGLTPIIINIFPANIPMILGLKKDVDVELSDNGRWQFLDRGHLQALKVSHDGVILGLKEEDGDIELSKLN